MNRLIVQIYLKNDLTTKHTFSPYFSSLVKNEKGFEAHFYNSEKGTPGVFFQLFSDSNNVKILPSTCLFELIKVNELISTRYKFNPFLDWDGLFTKKGIPWLKMTKEVLSDIILHFFGFERQIYEKVLLEFSFVLFFRLSKYEKGPGYHCR